MKRCRKATDDFFLEKNVFMISVDRLVELSLKINFK
jgi:hypothetical protein